MAAMLAACGSISVVHAKPASNTVTQVSESGFLASTGRVTVLQGQCSDTECIAGYNGGSPSRVTITFTGLPGAYGTEFCPGDFSQRHTCFTLQHYRTRTWTYTYTGRGRFTNTAYAYSVNNKLKLVRRDRGQPAMNLQVVITSLLPAVPFHPVKIQPSPAKTLPVVTITPATTIAAACELKDNLGKCYQAGEFCSTANHGASGIGAGGALIKCDDNDGWRWEAV